MKKLTIYGAGGFGREVAWLADTCGDYEVVCFVDDDLRYQGKSLNGIPVFDLDHANNKFNGAPMVVALGSPKSRQKITKKAYDLGFRIENLIHPRTEMSHSIDFDEGAVICAGCILTTNIQIKKHVQINLDCTIGHDVVLEDYTTLAPGVHVSGWVHFGKRVYVGTGAVFINGTEENPLILGDDAVIGAGACVTKSIPPCETWGGIPAKQLK